MVVCKYFLLFMIYSICGWLLEVSCKLVSDRKFINRGFLIGPYCPIYGWGAILMTLLLKRYYNDPFTLFIMNILICSILEYVTSYVLEKLFSTRWWDYSNKHFQINGRICLETMIPFGLFGLFIIYISNPFFLSIIDLMTPITLISLSVILFIVFLIDSCFSLQIMSSLPNLSSHIKTDSTEKITKQVKEEIIKRNKRFQKRLIFAFPKLEVLYSLGIENKKKRRERRQKIKIKF